MNTRAAIYHYTDKSLKRPSIYMQQIELLTQYAKQKGYKDVDVYCDKDLLIQNHPEYNLMLSNITKYTAVIIKDFTFINRYMTALGKLLEQINIPLLSIAGEQISIDYTILNKSLKVITYSKDTLPKMILQHFIETKTNWTILEQYIGNKEISNQGDLILLYDYSDVHEYTRQFCAWCRKMKKPVYILSNNILYKEASSELC